MGNGALITKEMSYPVEKVKLHRSCCFSKPHFVNVPMMTGESGGGGTFKKVRIGWARPWKNLNLLKREILH